MRGTVQALFVKIVLSTSKQGENVFGSRCPSFCICVHILLQTIDLLYSPILVIYYGQLGCLSVWRIVVRNVGSQLCRVQQKSQLPT